MNIGDVCLFAYISSAHQNWPGQYRPNNEIQALSPPPVVHGGLSNYARAIGISDLRWSPDISESGSRPRAIPDGFIHDATGNGDVIGICRCRGLVFLFPS